MTIPVPASRLVSLLRYHRPQQFAWRLFRTLQRRGRSVLPEHFVFRRGQRLAGWSPGGRIICGAIGRRRCSLWPQRSHQIDQLDRGIFCFLASCRDLSVGKGQTTTAIRWQVDAPRLWRFHLQSQEYLLEVADRFGDETAWGIVGSWIDHPSHQSPLRDADAWHPFCISRRLPVWLGLAALNDVPKNLNDRFWRCVADQLLWLKRNREWDLGGNHLLENLSTLFLAERSVQIDGVPFDGDAESRLVEELACQVLPSGEHYERTPTYHLLMTVCVLQSLQACRDGDQHATIDAEVLATIERIAARMISFADILRQPNGVIPLLGDSVRSETPDVAQLREWADDLGIVTDDTTESEDYWLAEIGSETRLLFDMGPIACDHLPAHGHADLLQITACVGGYEAIVDTGTYQYEPGEQRQLCRQTAAHNVLQLGTREQCDVWSSFRMGRRGHILWKQTGSSNDVRWAVAAHDGFGIPSGRAVLATGDTWTIIDWFLNGLHEEDATTRLHLHPDWILQQTSSKEVNAKHPRSAMEITFHVLSEETSARFAPSVYCSDFGLTQNNVCCEFHRRAIRGSWLGYSICFDGSPTPDWGIQLHGDLLSVALRGRPILTLDCKTGGEATSIARS